MQQVSILMSIYSEEKNKVIRAINSMFAQTFSNFEFIIILDDPENLEVKKYLQLLKKNDSRIKIIENEKNIWLWASLNKWIEIAKWKYIARMDADDECDKEKLKKQFHFLESNSSVDLLFTWWEENHDNWEVHIRIPSQMDFQNIKKTFFYKSPLLHASMMCKRRIFEKYAYPAIQRPEDFSLFLELIHDNYNFRILEESLYSYYLDAEDSLKKYEKIRVFSSNYLKILNHNILKYWNNPYFWFRYFILIVEWLLSRNAYIFHFIYEKLQWFYKKIICLISR